MKSITSYKQTLRKVVPSTVIAYAVMKREHPDYGIKDVLLKARLVKGASAKNAPDEFVRQSAKMYRMIDINTTGQYVYPYDSWVGRIVHRRKTMITSVTVDYKTVLESSLANLCKKLQGEKDTPFAKREQEMIGLIRELKDRIVGMLNERNDDRAHTIMGYLNVMLDRKPESLDEAIQNDLTEIFLEVFTELIVPDPKLILRVNKDTSDVIWRKAIDCILTGCGSPLIINEKKVMDGMVEFGYDKDDVWNFGTSACWEPLIIGKSFDQNNPLLNIPVIDSLNKLMESGDSYESFDELLDTYKVVLKKQVLENIQDVEFDCSPLYSLFFDDCIDKQKDFSEGGAKYAYHGVQIVSFPNLINALLNLKSCVFEQKLFSMYECRQALKANFKGYDDMRQVLKSNPLKFGSTDKAVVDLTNDLMQFISEVVATKTMNGKKTKVGFSSSHYLIVCKGVGASMDGRLASAPFAVHISPVSQKIDLQEVLDFAGSLDYSGNKMNGNVVDFIVPKAYADAPGKLTAILKNAMTMGVYELQLNVLNAATLKDAKAHPENYPSLVVRVWGFSAYFNDLPEEYKDNLIARAEAYVC